MISETLAIDKELYELIVRIRAAGRSQIKSVNDEINYALQANARADSEHNEHSKVVNPFHGAGEWASTAQEANHWMVADLGNPASIHRFTIKHSPAKGYFQEIYTTIDFSIHGSLDNEHWTELVTVLDNRAAATTHTIEPTNIRYVKLNITKPCLVDNHARIHGFEIWGSAKTMEK